MTVTLENAVAQELITFKLAHLDKTIAKILERWKEDNIDDFIEKARTGELPEAEMDAITLRQLSADSEKLRLLLHSIN